MYVFEWIVTNTLSTIILSECTFFSTNGLCIWRFFGLFAILPTGNFFTIFLGQFCPFNKWLLAMHFDLFNSILKETYEPQRINCWPCWSVCKNGMPISSSESNSKLHFKGYFFNKKCKPLFLPILHTCARGFHDFFFCSSISKYWKLIKWLKMRFAIKTWVYVVDFTKWWGTLILRTQKRVKLLLYKNILKSRLKNRNQPYVESYLCTMSYNAVFAYGAFNSFFRQHFG